MGDASKVVPVFCPNGSHSLTWVWSKEHFLVPRADGQGCGVRMPHCCRGCWWPTFGRRAPQADLLQPSLLFRPRGWSRPDAGNSAATIEAIDRLAAEWLHLQRLSNSSAVFQSYAHIRIWVRHFLSVDNQPLVILVHQNGRLVLLLPLVVSGPKHFRIARVLPARWPAWICWRRTGAIRGIGAGSRCLWRTIWCHSQPAVLPTLNSISNALGLS